MDKKTIGKVGKIVLFLVPFFVGFYGILQLEQGTVLDCAYKTVQLYFVEYGVDGEKTNWATEFARWFAPLATAAVILSMLYSVVDNLRIWLKTKFTDVIAVHGDSTNVDLVLNNLGKNAIHSDTLMAFRAKRHILMFDDDFDMYHFMDEHGSQLFHDGKKEIYLCSENILRGSYENRQLVVCNLAENCARDYWKKYPLQNDKEKVLIIGFENYGQRLLTQAILKNVLSAESHIEYHVVGDYQSYLAKHNKLHKAVHVKTVKANGTVKEYKPYEPICDNQDTVYFHKGSWYDALNQKIKFTRIILCHDIDAQNIEILNELKTYYVNPVCHIKFTDKKILETLWDMKKEKLVAFGVNEELYMPEVILKEKLFRYAKLIHARYYAKWKCDGMCDGTCCGNKDEKGIHSLDKCLECPNFLNDWGKLNTFTRYSNVAQADHIQEKLRLLFGEVPSEEEMESEGVGKRAMDAYQALPMEEKKKLWQIEHIRWDRYHFMNNWDCAKERDNEKHLHHLLKQFNELPPKEQGKDEDAYIALGEMLE